MPNRRLLIITIKLIVSIGLILFLMKLLDWQRVNEAIVQADLIWLILSGSLVIFVVFMDSLRFFWMIPELHLRLSEHFRVALKSAFFTQLGFGVVSGDAYRTAAYALQSGTILKPATHIIVARIVGIFSLGIVALVASLWLLKLDDVSSQELGINVIKIVLIFNLIATLFFISLLIFIREKKIKFSDWSIVVVNALKTITLKVWILSVAMVIVRGVSFSCVLYATSQVVPFHVPFLASITATLSGLLPIAFGGLGIREGALSGTVALFGIPFDIAMSAAILMRLVTVVASSLGVILSLTIIGRATPP